MPIKEEEEGEICGVAKFERGTEGKSLVVLQVNCRDICNKILEFWNLFDTYNPDIVIGTESWLNEDVSNAEVFRGDYLTYRRDKCSRGGGVFICVKIHIGCKELWSDEEFEIIAVEINSRNKKFKQEIIGVYRAPNDDVRVIERLVDRTNNTINSYKRSIICGDLNVPRVDWNGKTEGNNLTQALVNRLVWDNGYCQLIEYPTRGDAVLDVYLVRPESSVTSSDIV
jgi:exonuclease III